jgi:hypothetical protein
MPLTIGVRTSDWDQVVDNLWHTVVTWTGQRPGAAHPPRRELAVPFRSCIREAMEPPYAVSEIPS